MRGAREVDVLVGLQWGSEGKGRVAAAIADDYDTSVRVGGPNAGHTMYYNGTKVVTRHIPSAWVNPTCKLLIGAGAAVRIPTLATELEAILKLDPTVSNRLFIDRNAVVIGREDEEWERSNLAHVASTAHGVGSAYMQKIARRLSNKLIGKLNGNSLNMDTAVIPIVDTVEMLHDRSSGHVLVEGTQGTLLSVDHGDWPFTTSRNPIAASLLGDCGLPPEAMRVFGVARTYPIRVGGPSGPMGTEITGEEIAKRAGLPAPVAETATVTGRPRRFAELDFRLLARAAKINGITDLFVTFVDYVDGSLPTQDRVTKISEEAVNFLDRMKRACELDRLFGYSWGPLHHQMVKW